MQSVDNSIKLVASGSSWYESTGQWVDWNRTILEGLGDKIDYLSIHRYWERSDDYYSYMGQSALDFEEKIKVTAAEIETVKAKKGFKNPISISVDEWGSFGRNFQSVLPIAQCLNSFMRHADVVKMANFTMMTSLLASDTKNGTFKSPLFYTFKLFSNNCRGNSVDTYVSCDTFNTEKFKGIPYLDVTTAYSKETNAVYINVINRHKDKAITTDITSTAGAFAGKAVASEINAVSLTDPFIFDKKDQYAPVSKEIDSKSGKLTYTFPPHSFTQIKVAVK
jgi:alpha-N-arabinofuranosidase